MSYRKYYVRALGATVAGCLTLGAASAQERVPVPGRTAAPARAPVPERAVPERAAPERTSAKPLGQPAQSEVAIPGCLVKLTLTEQQQEQVKGIVREYDADLAMVWKQFGERYMETIRTEALLLAAIEDNLTEPQRKQVRDQRRKTAQHQKALAGTDVKPNQATAQPASAVEDEIAIVGIALTPEQEEAADKLQEKYLGHLRSLNRDIQGLHTRLVSLEADKLVELENILTKEQLVQLHEFRQSAPVPAKVAARPASPTKND